jgi:3-phenylpropionate/cinnamic acid dioxygenase small subunit
MDPMEIVMIEQLCAKYGHLVDAKAWDRFDELFTADAVADYTKVNVPNVMVGLDEIVAFFRAAAHPSAHHSSNVWVEQIGSDVTVKSKFWVPYTRGGHSPKRWYGGDYDDIVVRTASGWRLARRACSERWRWSIDDGPIPERYATF